MDRWKEHFEKLVNVKPVFHKTYKEKEKDIKEWEK